MILILYSCQGAVAALHMVHCFHLAGFPKGLISCVTGKGSEIGDFLTMHPRVNCIRSFFAYLEILMPTDAMACK